MGGTLVGVIALVWVLPALVALVALIDAYRRPLEQWRGPGRSRTSTISYLVVGMLFPVVGLIAFLDYFLFTRRGLYSTDATTPRAGSPRLANDKTLDATVYLNTSDLDVAGTFERTLTVALRQFGLALVPVGRPTIGSWFRRFKIRARDGASSDEVRRRLRQVEQALDAHLEHKATETAFAQAAAIAKLAEAAGAVDDFVALAGRMLFTKEVGPDGRTRTFTRMLTAPEVRQFEENSPLMMEPSKVVEHLQLLASSEVPDALPERWPES